MLLRLPRPRRPLDPTEVGDGDPDRRLGERTGGEAVADERVAEEATADEHVTVEVVDSPTTVDHLAGALPRGWRVVGTRTPSHHPDVDLVVLRSPSAARLRAVLDRRPGVGVAVVLPADAPVDDVAGCLDAGVAVCVRGGSAALLAGHLTACRRRRDRTPG